jgi:protein-tyrosine phosphatase
VIDLHCHLLPGIDDGPANLAEALRLARAAVAAGTQVIVATPHVSWTYPNRSETIARRVFEVQRRLRDEGVALDVYAGAEIAMTRAADLDDSELKRLALGSGSWLLLEPPFAQIASGLELQVADLQRRGFRIMLAHPERCPAFHHDIDLLARLVEMGAAASLTAGSLDGRFGGPVQNLSFELLARELIHNIASDAHDERSRAPSILPEMKRAGLGPLADWLTNAVPAAVLAGEALPPSPRREPASTEAPNVRT